MIREVDSYVPRCTQWIDIMILYETILRKYIFIKRVWINTNLLLDISDKAQRRKKLNSIIFYDLPICFLFLNESSDFT